MRAHGVRTSTNGKAGHGSVVLSRIGRAAYRAAVSKCGPILKSALPQLRPRAGGSPTGEPAGGNPRRLRSHLKPKLVLALQRFASCMRGHGVNLPPPSTTGGGIFDTSHLNKNSPQFKAAETQCNGLLREAF
jgi:hypothetical protein